MRIFFYSFLLLLCSWNQLSAKCDCNAPVNHVRLLDQWTFMSKATKRKEVHFLITGCARCGTTFISEFFQLHGLAVKHEREADFGIVSWPMAADSKNSPWGPPSNNYYFKHILHQVRHPLKTIASVMATQGNKEWTYICAEAPEISKEDPEIVKAAKYWYYWNLKAESKSELTYRVENIEAALPEINRILGTSLSPAKLKLLSKDVNHRVEIQKLSWLDLHKSLNAKLYEKIVCLAERYGYDVKAAKQFTQNKGK